MVGRMFVPDFFRANQVEVTNIARKKSQSQQVNDAIRFPELRLIDQDGEMRGVVPTSEARRLAEEAGLDLVLVSGNPQNPVARIMDYGKYSYEQAKREREARKNQKTVTVKEVGMKLTTDEHDLNFKLRNAERFLQDGDRVKISIRFRGREMAHQNQGYDVMRDVAERLSDVAEIDRPARMEGRNMVMFLAPHKN